jgi:hypothetical protein
MDFSEVNIAKAAAVLSSCITLHSSSFEPQLVPSTSFRVATELTSTICGSSVLNFGSLPV